MELAADVDAVLFLRLPQVPSSRTFGASPVASLGEYRRRLPADRSQWQTAEVKPRRPPPSHL
jgi:hypothetical protein